MPTNHSTSLHACSLRTAFLLGSAIALVSFASSAQAGAPASNPASAQMLARVQPSRQGEHFVYSDGTQVRATDPSGHEGHVNANGSISFDDGTRVSHDPKTGVTIIDRANGGHEVRNPHGAVDDGHGHLQWGDGFRVRATDPQGRTGDIKTDGSVSFPDGTRVSHDIFSGDTKIVHPDGSVDVQRGGDRTRPDSSGAIGVDTKGNMMWRDGFGVPAHDPSGGVGHEIGGGWIGFSDGTMVSHDVTTGDTKMVRPDGTVDFNNARTGDHSSTPPQENGITSSPYSGTGMLNNSHSNNQGAPGATNGSTTNGTNNTGSTTVKPDKQTTSNTSSNNNSNSSNSNSGSSSGSGSGSGSTTDKTKPDKTEKVDKGKGMVVNGDGPGGNGGSSSGQLGIPYSGSKRLPGAFTTTPTPNDAPARPNGTAGSGATPAPIARGIGPGARGDGTSAATQHGARITLPNLVIDPDPNAMQGGGLKRVDPWGGRR